MNRRLAGLAERSEGKTLLDLALKLPRSESNKRYWDDDVHMTPSGYDLLGSLLFDTMKSQL